MANIQYHFLSNVTPVNAVATSNQAGTYYNGPLNNGVGATFTYAAGLVTIDSYALNIGDRIAFSGQTSGNQNGIWDVIQLGATGSSCILKRSNDFQSIDQLKLGMYFSVAAGSIYAGSMFTLISPLPSIFGIDNIVLSNASAISSNNLSTFDVTVGQSALASAGSVTLVASSGTKQFKIRSLEIQLTGTNFSGGSGNRLGQITDGTNVYSVIPAASLQTLANARWGSTALPYPVSISNNTPTVAGANLVFKYSGGTTDYTSGSIVVSGIVERVA